MRIRLLKLVRGIRAILSLSMPRTWGPFLHAFERTKFNHDFSVSFSQGGEDLALLKLFENQVGKYLDIGAHHPDRFSNTRLLYDRGWSGVNVEANPQLISYLKKKRPLDETICAFVGSKDSYEFTVFKEPALSTANKEWKNRLVDHKWEVDSEIIVKGITLFELINKYFPHGELELLLVDAEGSDFEVIESGNFKSLPDSLLPTWILIETPTPVSRALQQESIQYLATFGYTPYFILPMSTILKKS